MMIYTLNVGQGQFVVVTGDTQAFIVDTYLPMNAAGDIVNIKGALATILQGKELVGLIVSGFDSDHFNEIGMKVILNKYRPDWIMYPQYFKATQTAGSCFAVIKGFEGQKAFGRHSVCLNKIDTRFYYKLSSDFSFEVFSPHTEDMNSSNNCSLVCKVRELSTGRTYMVTGDTENDRWTSITRYFRDALKADVLAAPHHGSRNGITEDALAFIQPHTVLISAGFNNQYGHPDGEAVALYNRYAQKHYSTSWNGGQSIKTIASSQEIRSVRFSP